MTIKNYFPRPRYNGKYDNGKCYKTRTKGIMAATRLGWISIKSSKKKKRVTRDIIIHYYERFRVLANVVWTIFRTTARRSPRQPFKNSMSRNSANGFAVG